MIEWLIDLTDDRDLLITGLSPCLQIGKDAAVEMALRYNKPIVQVNHLEAHAMVIRLEQDIEFPLFSVIVSGGHSLLVGCTGVGKYKLYGVRSSQIKAQQRQQRQRKKRHRMTQSVALHAFVMGHKQQGTLDDSIGEADRKSVV